MRRVVTIVCLGVALALATTSCTGSVDVSFGGQSAAEAAVELIEDDAMQQRLGVAPITDAECDEPVDEAVGTTFACTAISDGQSIGFDVLIEEDDRIFAGSTNVVSGTALTRLETVAVQELNRQNGFSLPDDALECGERSVILDADQQMICILTDPDSGMSFEALVTVTDVDTGRFDIEILGEA